MSQPLPFEPFRIKVVEPIPPSTREQRVLALERAGFNLFGLPSDLVLIDLLTDSGTAAMSDAQWAALITGDEAYAGGRSFARLEETVRRVWGLPHVIPTHQGRAAENILFSLTVKPGDIVPNNVHFDTTRANVEAAGGVPADCVGEFGWRTEAVHDFKGDIDLAALERALKTGRVPLAMATVTCNSNGGQPVSLANLRAASALCKRYHVPFLLDACRFAENAWFIHTREDPRPVREIVRDMFAVADGCTFSAKKDGLANIGGLFATRDARLAEAFKQRLVLTEGFPTYGGLAGRDLAAIAVGIEEAMDERYLEHRTAQVRWLCERLHAAGVPVVRPAGGHAVFLDARRFLPHVPPEQFPGQSLCCALYVEGGIRGCEIGTLMFGGEGQPSKLDLVRLAIPRRVYTVSHLDYVAEHLIRLHARRAELHGYRIVEAPKALRHFTARLAPVG